MPARNLLGFSCVLFVFLVASSCQDMKVDEVGETYLDLPAVPYSYSTFNDTIGDKWATLGRVLFYDRSLSLNNTIACASCHKQSAGFADDVRFSRGFEGRLTTRNSMPTQNLATFFFFDDVGTKTDFVGGGGSHFFWDGRESSLESLVLQPVGNHIEMGMTDIETLKKKLSDLPYYAPLFEKVSGSPEITATGISQALTAFVTKINTGNSRFDRFVASRFIIDPAFNSNVPPQTTETILSPLEAEGMLLFQDKYDCNACHQVQSTNGYQFLGGTFANIGLDQTYSDVGLSKVTGDPADVGKFKIPSLRNVEFTAPYMHDGRFATLEEVVDHYSEGIANHPNLDDKLKGNDGLARSMNISDHEKQAIVAFLRTLSDKSVITDPKFSNPFKVR
jgi:cytochrome c peroxidase